MKKLPSYKLALFQKARAEQQICKDWLIRIMRVHATMTPAPVACDQDDRKAACMSKMVGSQHHHVSHGDNAHLAADDGEDLGKNLVRQVGVGDTDDRHHF